ncbi:pentatricopeptide repeat-containing protein At5g04780, mitochondrial [Tripterygium wilfordii]|uniref:pentatricopeptide repeat-containing protein At5g04780, mitochondrial n=1 Tax=Tripterygium wilfordii TaxID=458696 RepID=UPI0018F82BBE|nr:pentatricopeptide repeat-containing protein At5g04780, mitochondrial [Tripterygium wilfordii]
MQISTTRTNCKRFTRNFWFHYKSFSAAANAPTEENLVWVGTSATAKVSYLHALLQFCARERLPMEGKACHAQILHIGLQNNALTSNILTNLYSKCSLIEWARTVFDKMPERTLVSWNTMIGSYAQNGQEEEALGLFVEMQRVGDGLSEFTLSSVLCACAAKCDVLECKQLHCFSIKAAMDSDIFVGTALLDLYAKCGLVNCATQIFDCMPERNAVTWSSMVAGYVQNELYEEALLLFHKGQMIGLEYSQFTISSVISACAGLAAMIQGTQVHGVVCKTGFGSNNFVASSLIEMYARCGCVRDSYVCFSCVEGKNIVLWNSIISGFAKHACSIEAMVLFEKMQQTGMRPDEVTYLSVLTACSHMGLVEKGWRYFDLMIREHHLPPNVLHYSCMVDILGRAGLIREAYELIEKMPFDATTSTWGSLLASSRNYGNVEFAEIAAKHLFEMEPNNAGNHVLLSNTYAANKKWDEVVRARKLLKESEAMKDKGMSWIEIKDNVHTFIVGGRNHPRIADIYLELDRLLDDMKKLGHQTEIAYDLHHVEDTRKQELLRHHSEKLALTFGLMCLPPGVPIRIMKNLRICGDCHTFMKLASKITGREIIVRDVNRFHHFKSGCCSCREFW